MKVLQVPKLSLALGDGSIVTFQDDLKLKWILHHGHYESSGEEFIGWYFLSIPFGEIRPQSPELLDSLVVLTAVTGCNHEKLNDIPNTPEIDNPPEDEPEEDTDVEEDDNSSDKFIWIPHLQVRLNHGSVVRLKSRPDIKWTLNRGVYKDDDSIRFGWYLLSILYDEVLPISDEILEEIEVINISCDCDHLPSYEPIDPPEDDGDEPVDYRDDVINKPTINDVVVAGDKTSKDYGLQSELPELSAEEVIEIWNTVMYN